MGRLDNFAAWIGKKLIRYAARRSNMVQHAKSEWKITFPTGDPMQDSIGENILDMVSLFSLENHSGFSAAYATIFIEKALEFEPFSPLTGSESEWGEPFNHEGTRQNKRCSHVFKSSDGKAYDINGRVFRDESGACFTSSDSWVDVTFPYVPTTEYVSAH
jgi:hypothetical protein